MPRIINVLAFPNVQVLDVTGPLQVFASANDLARQQGLPLPYAVSVIAAQAEPARRMTSVCTGAFLLAASGLLDGRRVVTHWTRCEELARKYPQLTVEANPIFI
eukprot:gene13667-16635_t